jgi:hypothetical protein
MFAGQSGMLWTSQKPWVAVVIKIPLACAKDEDAGLTPGGSSL